MMKNDLVASFIYGFKDGFKRPVEQIVLLLKLIFAQSSSFDKTAYRHVKTGGLYRFVGTGTVKEIFNGFNQAMGQPFYFDKDQVELRIDGREGKLIVQSNERLSYSNEVVLYISDEDPSIY